MRGDRVEGEGVDCTVGVRPEAASAGTEDGVKKAAQGRGVRE
jgi:hypothetical protein